MALTEITDRPTSTAQNGLGTVTGAANAHTALSDNVNTSYVTIPQRARLDSEVMRVGFTAPASIPAGAKILSVEIVERVQTVLTTQPVPVRLHWFRILEPIPAGSPSGTTALPVRDPWQTLCPTSETTVSWFDDELGPRKTAPDGSAWDLSTNLANFSYDIGRGDDNVTSTLVISEVFRKITYQRISAVTITGPASPISTARTAITWTYTSADSQPQDRYRVALYRQSATVAGGFVPFDTPPLQSTGGWVQGEDLLWNLTDDLVDDTYVAYVQAQALWNGPGTFETAIASYTFTRTASSGGALTFPPNATLTSAVFDATNNRVALTMVPSSSSPTTVAYTVQASTDGGQSWTVAPGFTLIPATGMTPVVKYDRFFEIGVPTKYRVLSYSATTPNAAAAYSNEIPVTTYGDDWWIRHPTNPFLDTIIVPTSKDYEITWDQVMATYAVLSRNGGRVRKKVVYGTKYDDEGKIVFTFNAGEASAAYYDTFDQLGHATDMLFVQQPNGTSQWWALGPGSSGQPTKVTPIPTPGDPGSWRQRKVATGFTVVDPPLNYG